MSAFVTLVGAEVGALVTFIGAAVSAFVTVVTAAAVKFVDAEVGTDVVPQPMSNSSVLRSVLMSSPQPVSNSSG